MSLSLGQVPPLTAAACAGLSIVAFALLFAIRRRLRPAQPVVATIASTVVLAMLFGLAGGIGLPVTAELVALLPAAALVLMASRPLSADTGLRAAATLAAMLTLVSVFTGTLMTTVAATAAAGLLFYLSSDTVLRNPAR